MTTWAGFGDELRAARLAHRRSLRQVAAEVHCSHSTIARLEAGTDAGGQELVAALDGLYQAEGHFSDLYGSLIFPVWRSGQQLDPRRAKRVWQHTYPSGHGGDVWLLVKPAFVQRGSVHELVLRWGPWRQQLRLVKVDQHGSLCRTGKSAESIPVPLRVEVSPAAHLLFGVDNEQGDLGDVHEIHDGWTADQAAGTTPTWEDTAETLRQLAVDGRIPPASRHLFGEAAAALQDLDAAASARSA